MKKQLLLLIIGAFFSFAAQAQENIPLRGKIIANNLDGSAVHIINKSQQTGTVNSSTGTFVIEVKQNDTLLFSSIQFVNEERVVTKEDLKAGVIEVNLIEDVNELAEVNISNIKLTLI
ncbi:carboxypeptidase-like regulatory domain-containing protein [Antarcticibacterium sp. 1MA-6-2]|uniref:carboxypeptidase-like regulatory domain-containing protein n=1 Tax=Antarcticibacterium sp. 1MA-6-2 TaxID=2908210 RepID=UPI001F48DF4A|nr:carboxypeptidase-like regulatory domain-containing protein [Antarcticibacterium sp. 1MA-6-2]UJH91091.1 carboxypeptidase-like regulatory domain-containing protein [Antarcticibacterium sp. 1MA-6-2]